MTSDPVQSPSAPNLLVVDDSAVQRSKLRMAVHALGHLADTAKDGASALEMLRSRS
jgi:CheY-like chemotaxis protein